MSPYMALSIPGSYPADDFDDGASDHSSEHSEAYFLAPEYPEASFPGHIKHIKQRLKLQANEIQPSSSTHSRQSSNATTPVLIRKSSIPIYEEPSKDELIRRSEERRVKNTKTKQYRHKRKRRASKAYDNTRLSLLSFPGELRNRIYFYLFGGDILKLDYKPLERYLPRPRMLRFGLNLLLTCHTLERELCDYVFDVCTFSFYSDQAVWKFAGMVQETNVSRIQKLHLDVPLFYNTDIRRWSELFEKVVVKKFVELKYVEVDLQPRREVWVGRQPAALQEWISALKPLAAIKGGGAVLVNSGNMLLRHTEEAIPPQYRNHCQEEIARAMQDEKGRLRAQRG